MFVGRLVFLEIADFPKVTYLEQAALNWVAFSAHLSGERDMDNLFKPKSSRNKFA